MRPAALDPRARPPAEARRAQCARARELTHADTESWFARTREDGLGFADLLSMGKRPTPWRVLPSMQPSPGEYNPSLVRGLDFFIQQIALRNMTCVLMLGNMWPWSGGFAQYVSWADESSIPYMPPAARGRLG